MTRAASIESRRVSRRSVLAGVTTLAFPCISGCNDDSKTSGGESVSSGQLETEEDEYSTVRSNLEEILGEINRFPISEKGEFVFDLQKFESNFDYEYLLEETRSIQEELEQAEAESGSELGALRSIAKIAELRILVRLATHQAIAAGLSYGNRLSRGEYADATEAIQHGRRFLEELGGTAREIENEIGDVPIGSVSIDEYEPNSIQNTQTVLLEIVQWSALVYRSFEYASVGFDLFENAAEKIEDERVEAARSNFERAGVQFTNAQKVLERAHGRGKRLGYLVPLVQKLRCILPIYGDTSERFADSFDAWRSGDENRARKIAREVIERVDQRMAQCEDSEAI